MALEMISKLIDDLDGSDADETIVFTLDGESYQIDLSDQNAAALRKALGRYIDRSRRTTRRTPRPRGGKRWQESQGEINAQDVRTWAGENGIRVSRQGRLSKAVLEQFRASTGQ